jgi:hypothetical protein
VKKTRLAGQDRLNGDQRILRDSEFVQEVTSGIDDIMKTSLRLMGQRVNHDTLAEIVCKKYDISAGELRPGSRMHKVVHNEFSPPTSPFAVNGRLRTAL